MCFGNDDGAYEPVLFIHSARLSISYSTEVRELSENMTTAKNQESRR